MSGLHYIYELDGGGRERLVYLCSNCDCVLRVRRDLKPVAEVVDSLEGVCPSCGGRLEGATECRLAAIPEDWSSIDLAVHRRVTRKQPGFQRASSFAHFSLGFAPLDRLLRPLAVERLVTISGDEAEVVAELAAFRAQLPLERGGLNSTVLFIDGGNRSDPYLFASFARQYGVSPRGALRRVTTCRVFTMYQLADVVSRHLAAAVEDYAAQLVVISDLLGTFNEPELDDGEARRLLEAVERGVREVKKKALVMTTLVTPTRYDEIAKGWADTLVALSQERERFRAELLRHPVKERASSTFKPLDILKVER
jgi:hypothetical protein